MVKLVCLLFGLQVQEVNPVAGQGTSRDQDALSASQLHIEAGVAEPGLGQVRHCLPSARLDIQNLNRGQSALALAVTSDDHDSRAVDRRGAKTESQESRNLVCLFLDQFMSTCSDPAPSPTRVSGPIRPSPRCRLRIR